MFVKILLILSPIVLSGSTLEEKAGKLFVIPAHEEVKSPVGVIFMEGTTLEQEQIAQCLDPKTLTFQDAEWGIGMRLKDVPPLPKNLTLGAIQDMDLLRAYGRELARQCRLNGILCNLAPVVDVNRNRQNPVVGRRSFGDNPDEVSRRALTVMEGMHEGGILACAKHFPGHGDTAIDSHESLPKIETLELAPFCALIEAGVDLVMVGHLLFPARSDEPSSLSHEIITELLRKQLGFEGVIITDALNMKALSWSEEIATKALLAGADLVLFADPEVLEEIPALITHVIEHVPEELIDEKLARVEVLRKRQETELPAEQSDLCRTLFRHAVTWVGKEVHMGSQIALVQSHPDPIFTNFLKEYAEVHCFSYEEMEETMEYPHVIVQIGPGDLPLFIPEHAVVALFDTPYHLTHTPTIVGYENVPFAKEAVADVLFGKIPALGKLPIHVYQEEYGSGK